MVYSFWPTTGPPAGTATLSYLSDESKWSDTHSPLHSPFCSPPLSFPHLYVQTIGAIWRAACAKTFSSSFSLYGNLTSEIGCNLILWAIFSVNRIQALGRHLACCKSPRFT